MLALRIILYSVYALIIAGCCIVVLSENRNPVKALAWVLALVFLPVVGLVFYLFFGRSLRSLHFSTRHSKRKLLQRGNFKRVDLNGLELPVRFKNLIKLSDTLTETPFCLNNDIEIFTDGKSKFEALKEDLRNARHWICLQYYIFNDDKLGHEIADILKERAANGVEVNIIYDHVGSFSAPSGFFTSMRKAGVKAHPFFRVTFPQLANRINWRNHRKIVVVDGEIGYIGGMNIADRYVKDENWHDLHFRVRGEIVNSLIFSFALDWEFMHEPLHLENYDSSRLALPAAEKPGKAGMQFVQCGPTEPFHNLSMCYLKAIASARRAIYIETPYFLPPEALLNALEAAALAKLDVRIIIPRHSDSRLIQFGSFSYINRCLKAGIKFYLFEPGMLHSKMMIVDEEVVTVGSTNFDFRSFENNFEGNLWIYDRDFNARMREIFFADLRRSTKVTHTAWNARPVPQKALEALVRLFSPIL